MSVHAVDIECVACCCWPASRSRLAGSSPCGAGKAGRTGQVTWVSLYTTRVVADRYQQDAFACSYKLGLVIDPWNKGLHITVPAHVVIVNKWTPIHNNAQHRVGGPGPTQTMPDRCVQVSGLPL